MNPVHTVTTLFAVYVVVLVAGGLGQEVRQGRQFRFNLGSIFGRRPSNNNNNQQQDQQGGGQQRIDLGAIAGGLLGGIIQTPKPQENREPNPINGILGDLVSGALNQTDIQVGFKDGNLQVAVLPSNQQPNNNNNNNNVPAKKDCFTVSGSDSGKKCAFPFIYKGIKYEECILVDADDGKPWCSTLTDIEGVHVGGKGKWGHCDGSCKKSNANEKQTSVVVEGDINNTGLNALPWFPSDGKLFLPGQSTSNRILSLGLNQPNSGHGTCRSTISGSGTCRHLHHCLKPEFFNFFTFISNICIIQGRYLGACCPDSGSPAPTTTTSAPITPAPTTTRSTTAATTTTAGTTTTLQTTPRPRGCGVNAKRFQTRIVGGRPADPDEWPWLAALLRVNGGGSGQYCGATLISETHILTAAHCMQPFRKEDVRVKLGEYNFNVEGETGDQIFSIDTMILHEQYNNITFENDIAILKLDRPMQRTKSIYPLCLPERNDVFTNTRAYVIGWGTIYFGGPTSDILQEVNVRVWDPQTCATNYKKLGRDVLDTMLCAGEVNKDSCQGDSGGPLNCRDTKTGGWKLCGIVSWGAKCAEPEFPGVYTKVSRYLDWIQNNSI